MLMPDVLRNAILAAVLWLGAGSTARADIARIDLHGAIDPITAEYVVKGINRANAEHCQFVLIRLQTPGGFGTSM